MVAVVVGLAVAWGAHVAMFFLPASALVSLLWGEADVWTSGVLLSALIPQLFVVPWAWQDAACRCPRRRVLAIWRTSFLFFGFAAVTVYLLVRPSGTTAQGPIHAHRAGNPDLS